jgi:hypothetical protein
VTGGGGGLVTGGGGLVGGGVGFLFGAISSKGFDGFS